MQAFTAPMYNRNPKLQFAFSGTNLLEGRGLGMRTLGAATTKHGLPVPKYAFDGVYLNLTIYRHAQAAVAALGDELLRMLNKDEMAAWQFIATRKSLTSSELMKQMGFDERKAQRVLRKFQNAKLLHRSGKGRATRYEVFRR